MIFNLFKKKKTEYKKEEMLMIAIFEMLSPTFDYILHPLKEGILIGKKYMNKEPYINYTDFSLRIDLLNKYEDKKGNNFQIKGIKGYDLNADQLIDITIHIAYGLLMGYSTSKENAVIDITNIKADDFYIKEIGNEEFEELATILTAAERKLINPADVYELHLKGKRFYHLKDLDNGNFIGIDLYKKLYEITHDPFEIKELSKKLFDIL